MSKLLSRFWNLSLEVLLVMLDLRVLLRFSTGTLPLAFLGAEGGLCLLDELCLEFKMTRLQALMFLVSLLPAIETCSFTLNKFTKQKLSLESLIHSAVKQ